jgi:hypothetical protein
MNEAVIVAVIAGLPGALAAVGALIVTIRTGTKVAAVATQVNVVEKATNSMKDALVKSTGDEALARGIQQGKDTEKARHAERAELAVAPPSPQTEAARLISDAEDAAAKLLTVARAAAQVLLATAEKKT